MSQYHQGPHFPVSSSPILPLDVHPTRPRRRSQTALDPRLSFTTDLNESTPALPATQRHREQSPPRAAPADWAGGATLTEMPAPRFKVAATETLPQYAVSHPLPNGSLGWQVTPAPLNLVPYKPFPENPARNGTSFFYRSPTPSARQRTNQACEKCRERKTKCSGGRPTCVRCQTRGLICEYATESRVRGPSKARKRNAPGDGSAATSSVTRRTVGNHALRGPVNHPIRDSQSAIHQSVQVNPRTSSSWTSDGPEDFKFSGTTTYPRIPHLSLNSTQAARFTPGMPLRGLSDVHYTYYRSQASQQNGIPLKDREMPNLRISASMPQLRPGIIQHSGREDDLSRSSSSVYSGASLDASFTDFFSSSSESLHSRCPSSSSSPVSNSHSSPENQDILATGISSATIKLDNWPTDSTQENGQKHALRDSEDPVYRHQEDIPLRDIDDDTPRPVSEQFNASEWINGDNYGHSSSDYQFPSPAK